MFSRSPSALPAHTPGAYGTSRATHLCVSLVVDSASYFAGAALMHNTYPENIQEHSLRVAMIAHALALIRNRMFAGAVNPERTAVLALYHDASEVLTGDLPAPVKYFNPAIKTAYQAIEAAAARTLFQMLPEVLQADYQGLLIPDEADRVHRELVTAADKLCAYLKCL